MISNCAGCANHSVKDGRDYCNNRVCKTIKGMLCYCDVPVEDAAGTKLCTYVPRKRYILKKEA